MIEKIMHYISYIIKYVTPIFLGVVFIGSLPAIWEKIINKDIYEKLAVATDPNVIHELNKTLMFVNGSRIFLVLLYVGLCLIVYKAYRKNYAK